MTTESQQDQPASRRCVLLGAGAMGAVGVLSACSTASVPYDANGAGQAPSSAPASPVVGNPVVGNPVVGMGGPSPAATAANPATGGAMGAMPTGTLLGRTSEVPVGGGMVYPAAKVVVTQPAKGVFRAFTAVCTHVGCVCNQVASGTIDCPCHGSKFKITDGTVVAGPAAAPLAAKSITVNDGKILLT
jgi:Rieske Fe-S protein